MGKRTEPWDKYWKLDRRLRDWADWVIAYSDGLGWNVYYSDTDPGLRVQQRNDVHSDAVYTEIAHMSRDYSEALAVDNAYHDLPTRWRTLVRLVYVDEVKSKSKLAEAVNLERRDVGTHLWSAFEQLDDHLIGTRYSAAVGA